MFDIVIPYKKSDTQELKFALRSIAQNLWYDKIFIVGDMPKKIALSENLIYIPAKDKKLKNYSLFKKVLLACHHIDLGERFIYWHDDHFALQPISDIPAYYDKTLGGQAAKLETGAYYRYTVNTIQELGSGDYHHYDIHTPCIMYKDQVKQLKREWEHDMLFKSLYLNLYPQQSEYMSDLKLNYTTYTYEQIKGALTHRLFFSTGEWGITKTMIKVLNELFPKKSPWEI